MNWFVWRQHRKQFLAFGVLLALYAAIAIPTGLRFWHNYQYAASHCMQFATPLDPRGTCDQLRDTLFTSGVDVTLRLIPIAVLFLPAILAMFLGAPLLAKEYNEGTNKLAWTQSTSRKKWLSVKLAGVLTATLVLAAGFAAFSTWWSHPINTVYMNRFNTVPFSMEGIVPIGSSIFAVSVAIAAGAWLRRTMAAIGIALVVFIGLSLIAIPNFVRPHYMKPVVLSGDLGPDSAANNIPTNAWVLSHKIVDKNGKEYNNFSPATMPAECQQLLQNIRISDNSRAVRVKVAGGDPLDDCLNQHGYREFSSYQPSYRYWDFQRIETGLYLALSILPISATYWLVLKRDA